MKSVTCLVLTMVCLGLSTVAMAADAGGPHVAPSPKLYRLTLTGPGVTEEVFCDLKSCHISASQTSSYVKTVTTIRDKKAADTVAACRAYAAANNVPAPEGSHYTECSFAVPGSYTTGVGVDVENGVVTLRSGKLDKLVVFTSGDQHIQAPNTTECDITSAAVVGQKLSLCGYDVLIAEVEVK